VVKGFEGITHKENYYCFHPGINNAHSLCVRRNPDISANTNATAGSNADGDKPAHSYG
jgi:hypothetical protein